MLSPLNRETVAQIQEEYSRSTEPWFLGYSGGKDSSTLLKLVFISLSRLQQRPKPVVVIYCDSGVEIPPVKSFVIRTLQAMTTEARKYDLPIQAEIVSPLLKDRYFVKVIGRGYPPPTNKFRWCTERLRTKPLRQAVQSTSSASRVLLLGTRREESTERREAISRHKTAKQYYFRQSKDQNTLIYSPIVDYTDDDIWATLTYDSFPKSINATRLLSFYDHEGRLGCWTCTVVRRDRATESLIESGHGELDPLLTFRNWLLDIRGRSEYRCKKRRNGSLGPGPFTLAARQVVLDRLLNAQGQSGLNLIGLEELQAIRLLWEQDRFSTEYLQIE